MCARQQRTAKSDMQILMQLRPARRLTPRRSSGTHSVEYLTCPPALKVIAFNRIIVQWERTDSIEGSSDNAFAGLNISYSAHSVNAWVKANDASKAPFQGWNSFFFDDDHRSCVKASFGRSPLRFLLQLRDIFLLPSCPEVLMYLFDSIPSLQPGWICVL